jgi:VanZ family protein
MNSFLKQLCRYHILSVLCAAGILFVCVIRVPDQDKTSLIPYFDKIAHFTMFFSFSLLFIAENRMLDDRKWKKPIPLFMFTLGLTALLGGLIELVQGVLTDYRSAEMADWYSDLAGSFTAVVISGIVIGTRSLAKKALRK